MLSLLPKPLAEINSYCHANREQGTLYFPIHYSYPVQTTQEYELFMEAPARSCPPDPCSTIAFSQHQELIIPTQTVPHAVGCCILRSRREDCSLSSPQVGGNKVVTPGN